MKIIVSKNAEICMAHCKSLNICSYGDTEVEALEMFVEHYKVYLEETKKKSVETEWDMISRIESKMLAMEQRVKELEERNMQLEKQPKEYKHITDEICPVICRGDMIF